MAGSVDPWVLKKMSAHFQILLQVALSTSTNLLASITGDKYPFLTVQCDVLVATHQFDTQFFHPIFYYKSTKIINSLKNEIILHISRAFNFCVFVPHLGTIRQNVAYF